MGSKVCTSARLTISVTLMVVYYRVGAFISFGLFIAANALMSKHPLAKPRSRIPLSEGVRSILIDVPFIFSLLVYVLYIIMLPRWTFCPSWHLLPTFITSAFISGLGLFFPCKESPNIHLLVCSNVSSIDTYLQLFASLHNMPENLVQYTVIHQGRKLCSCDG